jgi:hypothetical protein
VFVGVVGLEQPLLDDEHLAADAGVLGALARCADRPADLRRCIRRR